MQPNPPEKNIVAILVTEPREAEDIVRIIETGPYRTIVCRSLSALKNLVSDAWMAVILDVDSIPLDNRTIRNLTLTFPAVSFFCTSRERFHPELKDAICYHLFACLNKPINADELHYLLKCVRDEETDPGIPPGG